MELRDMEGLTKNERADFERCKGIVKAGLASWVSVSLAMIEIRDKRLYRDEYDTFEACCTEEFGISRRHAYRLIEAASVAQEIENARNSFIDNKTCVQLETNPQTPVAPIETPEKESQLRELAKAPKGERAAVLAEAQKKTGKAQPTAKDIQKVVATRAAKPAAEPEAAEPWAEFVAQWSAIKTRLRSCSEEMREWLDCNATTRKPANKWAAFISYDGSVGALNTIIRVIDDNLPGAVISKLPGYEPVRSTKAKESIKAK